MQRGGGAGAQNAAHKDTSGEDEDWTYFDCNFTQLSLCIGEALNKYAEATEAAETDYKNTVNSIKEDFAESTVIGTLGAIITGATVGALKGIVAGGVAGAATGPGAAATAAIGAGWGAIAGGIAGLGGATALAAYKKGKLDRAKEKLEDTLCKAKLDLADAVNRCFEKWCPSALEASRKAMDEWLEEEGCKSK